MAEESRLRPVRSSFSSLTEKVPKGPLEVVGDGNMIGAANYFTVAAINGIIPVNGVDVGYNIQSHSVNRTGGKEEHTFIINSANKNVAKFIAKIESAPSNIDHFKNRAEVTSIEPIEERMTFTTWSVVAIREEDPEGMEVQDSKNVNKLN